MGLSYILQKKVTYIFCFIVLSRTLTNIHQFMSHVRYLAIICGHEHDFLNLPNSLQPTFFFKLRMIEFGND